MSILMSIESGKLEKGDFIAIHQRFFDGGRLAASDPDAFQAGQYSHGFIIRKVYDVNERGVLGDDNIFYPKKEVMGHAERRPAQSILHALMNQVEWEIREIFWK